MIVDLSMEKWQRIIDVIEKLENMDFPEITDGNKQSNLFEITSVLNDFVFDLVEELDA